MSPQTAEPHLLEFRRSRDRSALAKFYDASAPGLLRAALSWTRDEADAQDAVHETLIAVIRSPEAWDSTRPLRPWLLGVLRHRCAQLYRDSDRQIPSDGMSLRTVQEPDELAMQLELSSTLEEAMGGLPLTLGHIASEHFKEGKSALRISREKGVHPNTVYRRIKKARSLLVGKLAQAGLGVLVALGLAGRSHASARAEFLRRATGVSSVPSTWSALMPILVLGALACLLGAVGYMSMSGADARADGKGLALGDRLTRSLDGPEGDPVADMAHATESSEDSLAQSLGTPMDQAASPLVTAQLPRSARPSAALQAVVVDPLGAPLAGARVLVFDDLHRESSPVATFETGVDGAFEVPALPTEFSLTVESEGLVCARGLHGISPAEGTISGFVIPMAHPVAFEGVVSDRSGAPVAGVAVMVHERLTKGRSADQSSVPNVAWFNPGVAEGSTDAAGRFRLTGLPPGLTAFVAMEPHSLTTTSTVELPSVDRSIVLVSGSGLNGRILGQDGRPIQGASVQVSPHVPVIQSGPGKESTGPNGQFKLSGLPRSDHWPYYTDEKPFVTVSARGQASVYLDLEGLGKLGPAGLVVHLEPEQVLRGRLVDTDGAPLEGYTVRLAHPLNDGGSGVYGYSEATMDATVEPVTSNEAGAFEVHGVSTDECALRIYSPGELSLHYQRQMVPSSKAQVLVLDPSELRQMVLLPRVLDALTGESLTDEALGKLELRLLSKGAEQQLRRCEASSGLEFFGAAPGDWATRVGAPGYRSTTLPARSFGPGRHHVDVELMPLRQLKVRGFVAGVDDPCKLDVRGWDASGESIVFSFALTGKGKEYRGQIGSAVLSQIPAGLTTLRVGTPGFLKIVEVDLTEPRDSVLEVELEPLAEVLWPITFLEEAEGEALFGESATFEAIHASLRPTQQKGFRKRYAGRALRPATDPLEVVIESKNRDITYRFRLVPGADGSLRLDPSTPSTPPQGSEAPCVPGRVHFSLLQDFYNLNIESRTHESGTSRIYNYHPVELSSPTIVVLKSKESSDVAAGR